MKILLFVTSIYKTLDDGIEGDYKRLVENLEKIQNINEDDIVYISFCDNTQNRDILLFHIRKLADKIIDKHIYFGEQFLGDVHYKDINSGAILYENNNLNKLKEIINYSKKLKDNGNDVELIIADGDMNIESYKNELNNSDIAPFTLISGKTSLKEINYYLEKLYDLKEKKLQLD